MYLALHLAHTLHASRARARRGMSLLEILISIGIVAVGLMGMAILLPMAGRQATQGLKEDRAAAVGRRAFREFMLRGYANRDVYWVFDGSQGPDDNAVLVPGRGICIDPLRCAQYIEANNSELVVGNVFFPPATIMSPGNMQCVTVKARATSSGSMKWAQALDLCQSHDELTIEELDKDHSVAAKQKLVMDGSNALKRDDSQDFTWFATVTNAAGQQALLSIVVVYKRDLTFAVNASTGDQRAAEVRYAYNDTVAPSGGEVFIFGANADQLEVKPGWWVMMVSSTPHARQHRWYRVANVSQVFDTSAAPPPTLYPDTPSGAKYRTLTLQGPDFPRSASENKMVLVKGAVSVYEKMIRLEKGSLYNLQ